MNMKKLLNIEYAAVNGGYWMVYGVVCSFSSVFLLGKGYSNADIGIILAVGSVAAVFMQPLLADMADRSKKVSLIGLTEIVAVIIAALTAVTFAAAKASAALTVIFVMMVAWVTALQPLINSLAFKLSESGHEVNFGIARSMGSLAYSILCAVLGTMAERYGIFVLPVAGEVILAVLMLILIITARHFKKSCEEKKEIRSVRISADSSRDGRLKREKEDTGAKAQSGEDINLMQFVKRNKLFLIASLGVGGIFFSNAVFNSFMLQIVEGVGVNSEDMGRVFSLMAFCEIPPMFFFSRVHKKFSCEALLKFAAVCFTAKVIWAYLASNVAMIFVAQVFQLVSFGLFVPGMVCFIDEIMERGEAVKGQALYTIMITVSTVFASFCGGFIIDLGGASALLLIASAVTAAGTLLFIAVIGKIKKRSDVQEQIG